MDETSQHPSTTPQQAPRHDNYEVDSSQPHAGRVYDYFLGGSENFPPDREFAERVIGVAPFVVTFARANKSFLTRAVRFMAQQGVRQFIDVGCGFPNAETVHDIAWQASPWAKILYADYDPLVFARMKHCIDDVDPEHKRLEVLKADVRDVDTILGSEQSRMLLDFTEPIGLLIVATLHFLLPGDDVTGMLGRYRDALPSGSYFAASHMTMEGVPYDIQNQAAPLKRLYHTTTTPGCYRTREEFTALFDGFDLVEPGVVWAPEWRPDNGSPAELPSSTVTLVGVGAC